MRPAFYLSDGVPILSLGKFQAIGEDALNVLALAGGTHEDSDRKLREKVFNFLYTQGVEL